MTIKIEVELDDDLVEAAKTINISDLIRTHLNQPINYPSLSIEKLRELAKTDRRAEVALRRRIRI